MKNKKILITGATKGLGLECVKFFLKKNKKVIAMGRDDEYLKELSKKIVFIKGDLLKSSFRGKLYRKLLNIKDIDIVIHCLGGGLGYRDPLIKLKNFIDLFLINLGVASEINNRIIKSLNPKSSYIIHIGSTASSEAIGSVGYNSVKAAVVAYVKSLATNLIKNKIFVSCILPGAFIAPGNAFERLKLNNNKAYLDFKNNRLPRKRVSKASELMPLLNLLTSKKGEMLAGSSITIDACETKAYNL